MTPWGSGWHVDRAAFDKLLATAAAQAGATLLLGTSVVRATGSARGWTVHASQSAVEGHSHALLLSAPVLIDATGRTTRLARSVGAHRLSFDRLVAIASELDLGSDVAQGYVMVESVPDGWWYTAPLPSGRMMVMLMTDGDLCRRHNLAAQTVWEERLQRAEASLARARGRRRAGGPQVTSAVSHRLRRGERTARWLAVGDAALAVDPISGSGVCRALQSARAGADATVAMLEGDPARAIMDYEDRCDAACTTYLEERALYYGLESRWSTPFWARRAPRRAS
jgi:flavin-dependent dehydrogenase